MKPCSVLAMAAAVALACCVNATPGTVGALSQVTTSSQDSPSNTTKPITSLSPVEPADTTTAIPDLETTMAVPTTLSESPKKEEVPTVESGQTPMPTAPSSPTALPTDLITSSSTEKHRRKGDLADDDDVVTLVPRVDDASRSTETFITIVSTSMRPSVGKKDLDAPPKIPAGVDGGGVVAKKGVETTMTPTPPNRTSLGVVGISTPAVRPQTPKNIPVSVNEPTHKPLPPVKSSDSTLGGVADPTTPETSLVVGIVFAFLLFSVVGFLAYKRVKAIRRRREYRRMNDFLIDGMYNDL